MGAGLDNPYAWLGLPVGTSLRDLRRRLEELSVQANLGLAPSHVTPDRLTETRRTLEDVKERMQAQMLWMLGPAVLGYTPNVVTTYEQLVAQMIEFESMPRRSELASKHVLDHDLGVVARAAFIEKPGDLNLLSAALRHFSDAVDDDAFWERFEDECVDASDPRSLAELGSLRAGSRRLFLGPVVDAMRLQQGPHNKLLTAIQILRDSRWPSADVNWALQALLQTLIAHAEAASGAFSSELAELDKLFALNADKAGEACARTQATTERLRDEWLPAFQIVRDVDPMGIPSKLSDGLARALLRLSPMAWPRCGLGPLGMRLFQIAIENGRTPTALAQVRNLESTARTAFHTNEMYEAKDRGAWATAAAHANFVTRFAPEDERADYREVEQALILGSGPHGWQLAADARHRIETEISLALDLLGRPENRPPATAALPAATKVNTEAIEGRSRLQAVLEWSIPADCPRRTLVKRALGAAFGGALLLRLLSAIQGTDSGSQDTAYEPSLPATKTPTRQLTQTIKPNPTATSVVEAATKLLPWEYVDLFDRRQDIDSSDPAVASARIEGGVLQMTVNEQGWFYWIDLGEMPENQDYQLTARITSVLGAGSIGLGLATPSDENVWIYNATPGDSLWSVYLYDKTQLSTTFEVEPRYTSALRYRRLTELSLTMINRFPQFRINGVNVAIADRQRIPLPQINGPRHAVLQIETPSIASLDALPLTVAFDSVSVRAI